jgi:hypothetical protein
MMTKPLLQNDERPAQPPEIPTGIARRVDGRLIGEAREALPPTIFLFVGFNGCRPFTILCGSSASLIEHAAIRVIRSTCNGVLTFGLLIFVVVVIPGGVGIGASS